MDIIPARLAAQRDLSRVLASARQVRHAALAILQAVSPHLGCAVSELWIVGAHGTLEPAAVWTENDSYAIFARDRSFRFERGKGLPGLAWERRSPQWMSNVAIDPMFERKLAANACGLRAAVAFPVVFEESVSGVVQFFYTQPREADAGLMESFADIGEQIGLYFERAKAEAVVARQASELLELSAPILRIAPRVILLPIIGTFDARRADTITERLLAAVVEQSAHTVVLDITSAGAADQVMAELITRAVASIRLLGADTILTGVQPDAARALALTGVDLGEVDVCSSLADGLARLRH